MVGTPSSVRSRALLALPTLRFHKLCQRLAIPRRHGQAEFRAPPQHVVREARPFLGHEIAYFSSGQVVAEARAEIVAALRIAEHRSDARAIGRDQAPGL